jgi:orotidine-5'-phosphate decarboxylase
MLQPEAGQGVGSVNNSVVVALDGLSKADALVMAERLAEHPVVWGFKVNDLLLRCGIDIIHELKNFGKVFVDPKLYDIPQTMTNSLDLLIREAKADIVTVHCKAGYKPPAHFAANIAGVTILTSEEGDLSSMIKTTYFTDCLSRSYRYLVCSGADAKIVRSRSSDVQIICPGIRPPGSDVNDQKQVMTPKQAIDNGANLLVVGRPITQSSAPLRVLDKLFES